MRQILIVIILFGTSEFLQAQQSELYRASVQDTETLFRGDVQHGGYGAPIFGVTSVNGQPSYLRGTRGAWIIKFDNTRSVNLGLASYQARTRFDAVDWDRTEVGRPEMRTNYGGFEMEYAHNTHRLFHYSIQTLIGSGTVRYDDGDIGLDKSRDSYFVLQPGFNVNLNITGWFRLSGGLYYRYAGNVNLEGTSNSDLSGLSSFVSLRFGRF